MQNRTNKHQKYNKRNASQALKDSCVCVCVCVCVREYCIMGLFRKALLCSERLIAIVY